MKKNTSKQNQKQEKMLNYIFGGMLIFAVILLLVFTIAQNIPAAELDYVITADGHVHTADGTHLGTTDEVIGEKYIVTSDGHVHAEDGTHVGVYEPALEAMEAPSGDLAGE